MKRDESCPVYQRWFEDCFRQASASALPPAAVEAAPDPLAEAQIEVARLRAAIRKHRGARGHGRCWLNDLELYAVLGEPVTAPPALPCREEFLQHCAAYYDQQTGQPSDTDHKFCEQCGDCVICYAGEPCHFGGTH